MEVRGLDEEEVAAAARLVARLQAEPTDHIGDYGTEASAIAVQMRELEPMGLGGAVAAYDGEELVGLLQAEWDTDPPRVWWHGPMIAAEEEWHPIAEALFAAARGLLPTSVVEEEFGPDARNLRLAAFAARHGFTRRTASAVLTRRLMELPVDASPGAVVRPSTGADRDRIAALHDRLFPATHTPGRRLDEGRDRLVLVGEVEGDLLGYVAAERQEDGEGYLDFLGVDPASRGRGLGRALVASACHRLRDDLGCPSVHLTVREDNHPARRLYAALGFTEERVLVPWRRGF